MEQGGDSMATLRDDKVGRDGPLELINHRITEWWGLEGTSVGHPVQPPAQAGSLAP